jgi:hypothetical protein
VATRALLPWSDLSLRDAITASYYDGSGEPPAVDDVDHPLWTVPSAIGTPHVAGGSTSFHPRARRRRNRSLTCGRRHDGQPRLLT